MKKLSIAIAIGLAAAALCPMLNHTIGAETVDFMWSLHAARDLAAGRDPYAAASHPDMIPYPLTAALVAAPLAPLPIALGAAAFMGLSSALLARGLLRDGEWWRLMTFISAPFYLALRSVQWSPLLMGVMYYPALLPLALAKPQFLAPMLQALTRRRALACAAFGAATLALDPTWPARWLAKIGPYSGVAPIRSFPLLAVAAIRWRDPRARNFLLLAIMPQQRYLYDSLLLWALPRTRGEMVALTAASWLTCQLGFAAGFRDHGNLLAAIGIYLPALAIVMRPPPLAEVIAAASEA